MCSTRVRKINQCPRKRKSCDPTTQKKTDFFCSSVEQQEKKKKRQYFFIKHIRCKKKSTMAAAFLEMSPNQKLKYKNVINEFTMLTLFQPDYGKRYKPSSHDPGMDDTTSVSFL